MRSIAPITETPPTPITARKIASLNNLELLRDELSSSPFILFLNLTTLILLTKFLKFSGNLETYNAEQLFQFDFNSYFKVHYQNKATI